MGFLSNILSNSSVKVPSEWHALVKKINALEEEFSKFTSEDFPKKTQEFKDRLKEGATLDSILPEAYALVREASKRTLGERHFDVQLLGGIALHKGGIAEMRTGEGKTLVATLPTYLNSITGLGVHVVTVNDYLSRRDAVWMGQIYAYLGATVGVLNDQESFVYDSKHTNAKATNNLQLTTDNGLDKTRDALGSFKVVHEFLRPSNKKEAYARDITYGTNNQFGFDYLRDNLVYDPAQLVQRGFNYAVVDEIDSILIDEARTPLIISGNTGNAGELYVKFAKIARTMEAGTDFEVDEKLKAITLTDAGIEKAEKALGMENMYAEGGVKFVHHLEISIKAKALYQKDKEYVVRDGEIMIVDEFTGRMQPGRRWSEGLHQAIEAKEGVAIKEESRTYASVTFQNYFRMYKKLSGCTGTALTSKEEFYKVYGLDVYPIPTNKPINRADHNDYIYQTTVGKMKAVAKKVRELHEKGQPVLVGTVSIESNEVLSAFLKSEGIPHELLNAKNHEREGEIIAQAGKRGKVTIATNMAGRGVDIKLGGNPTTPEEYEAVKATGGLFVLGTERHDARRIDNQLRGRAGRQGDSGETQFFVSLEDHLMRIFAVDTIKKMMGRFNIPEDEPIENKMITNSLEKAQERIEGFNFDARKHVLEYDDVLNYQRGVIYGNRRKILVGTHEDVRSYLEEIEPRLEPELATKLKDKIGKITDPAHWDIIRRVVLQTIDMFWLDHLETMDYLRGSVNLRAYGQRDPLVEYKKEGLYHFKTMESSIAREVATFITGVNENNAHSNGLVG
ncbi:MAG: preprotein translocase subunit SecA [Parcubacteria group bacterium]